MTHFTATAASRRSKRSLLSKNQLDWTSDWTSDWNSDWTLLVTEIVIQLLGSFRSTRTVVIGAAFFKKISFTSKILSHFLLDSGLNSLVGGYIG